MKRIWGILGGMGPLASGEFIRNIYSYRARAREQDLPNLFLISYPDIPDRTDSILSSRISELAGRLDEILLRMIGFGATDLVICCFTAHSAICSFSPEVRQALLSLPRLALSMVASRRAQTLILCTKGVAASGLFQNEPEWHGVSDYTLLPQKEDQEEIHGIIYDLKRGMPPGVALGRLQAICNPYGCERWLLGCTDLHLLSAHKPSHAGLSQIEFLDPLASLAQAISEASVCAA